MINGGTGPVLAFTEIIYKMSKSLDVPFLTFNAWIGVCKYSSFVVLSRSLAVCVRVCVCGVGRATAALFFGDDENIFCLLTHPRHSSSFCIFLLRTYV